MPRTISHSYYVVMRDFGGCIGFGADVSPEITRNGVIDRIASGEWDRVEFIHYVHDGVVEDLTVELKEAAASLAVEPESVDHPQFAAWDHARDLRKHEVA